MEGLISVTGKSTEQVKFKMLRDTGAIQSFIVAEVLPFSEQTFCGSNVLVQGIEMGLVKVLLSDTLRVRIVYRICESRCSWAFAREWGRFFPWQ